MKFREYGDQVLNVVEDLEVIFGNFDTRTSNTCLILVYFRISYDITAQFQLT